MPRVGVGHFPSCLSPLSAIYTHLVNCMPAALANVTLAPAALAPLPQAQCRSRGSWQPRPQPEGAGYVCARVSEQCECEGCARWDRQDKCKRMCVRVLCLLPAHSTLPQSTPWLTSSSATSDANPGARFSPSSSGAVSVSVKTLVSAARSRRLSHVKCRSLQRLCVGGLISTHLCESIYVSSRLSDDGRWRSSWGRHTYCSSAELEPRHAHSRRHALSTLCCCCQIKCQ